MPYEAIEDSRMYREAEEVADEIWDAVMSWNSFARDTVGVQLVRAADSIGANLAESAGRFHPKDVINFLYLSRGSLSEAVFFTRRAGKRRLIPLTQSENMICRLKRLAASINAYAKHQRSRIAHDSTAKHKLTEP